MGTEEIEVHFEVDQALKWTKEAEAGMKTGRQVPKGFGTMLARCFDFGKTQLAKLTGMD